ncbi:MAG: LuxR C-terminal-related transcriptional regulator [Patulibacter minatonensis]
MTTAPGMGGLPERELNGLLELLGEVHHAEDVESFRTGLLDVIPRVLPSHCTAYNEIAPDGSPLVVMVDPVPDAAVLASWGEFSWQSPLIQWHLQHRDPRAQRITDVASHEAFRATDLYREVFVPLGVAHQMAVTLPAPPTLLIGLTVAHPNDYTDAERKLLDLARPHLIQARSNAAARQRVREVLAAVERGLDDAGDAIVVADGRDRIEFATAAGREALALLSAGSGPVASEVPAGLRDAGGEGGRPSTELTTAEGALSVRRLTTGDLAVYVFERRGTRISRALLEGLGLSPREAEVLEQLMGGQSTQATAAALGISPRTVHKHAENLYGKLGVHDRIAAVSAAWAALDAGRSR